MNFNNPFNTVVVNQETNPEGTGGTRVEDIKSIDTWARAESTEIVVEAGTGISWEEGFTLCKDLEGNEEIASGRISHNIPIEAGEGVKFELDETNNVVKINAAGGSGGTTLNKYTFRISGGTVDQTAENRARVYRIFEQAKGRVMAYAVTSTDTAITGAISHKGYLYLSATSIYYYSTRDEYTTVIASEFIDSSGSRYSKYRTIFEPDGSITHNTGGVFGNKMTITYWNDIEIV